MTITANWKISFRSAVVPVLILFLASCSLTRDVEEGSYLLNKVKIKVDNPNLKPDIASLIKQKENNKILWTYRFRLRFYSSIFFKKDSDAGIRTNLGEPPVIYDSSSAVNSTKQISAYLKNKGYYRNHVEYEERYRGPRSKKIKVVYHVKPNKPTKIAGIDMAIELENIQKDFKSKQKNSLVKVGSNLDIDVLESERKRLTKAMQNEGYFFFSNDLIYYHIDTLKEKYKAFVTYNIKKDPVKYFGDSVPVDPYKTFRIHNVYVRQDFGDRISDIQKIDTIGQWSYYFLNEKSFTVKPKVISRSIFHGPDEYYILDNHENTYRRLTSLNNFKSVSITYAKSAQAPGPNYLDCFISLVPSQSKSFSIEGNGTSTGGIFGVNGTVSISNRNTFRGAELLRLSIYGGLEAQSVKENTEVVQNTPFNTIEIGPELSLVLPKFLLPVDQSRFSKRNIPKTTITFSYNYQQRPDYTRNILNGGLIYSWKESKTKSHAIQPINISQIKIDKSNSFQARLDSIGNSSLNASYEDNFITSLMYSFVYNDQLIKRESSYNIFRGNLEFAGNGMFLLDKNLLHTTPDENGQYQINGIPYAQFIRTYMEYVHNSKLNKSNFVVSRTFVGVGLPYGNSPSMPFVRSFYGGGTNGIRAWQARSLGPGSVSNDTLSQANVDQIGDIKLEQNLEYRFGIIKYVEGALFTDLGNIWALNNPDYSEQGNFKFNKIWNDLAIGAGAGLRLNFDYFVVRFDVAKRVKDPGAENPRTVKFFYSEPPVFNFAIGYPF